MTSVPPLGCLPNIGRRLRKKLFSICKPSSNSLELQALLPNGYLVLIKSFQQLNSSTSICTTHCLALSYTLQNMVIVIIIIIIFNACDSLQYWVTSNWLIIVADGFRIWSGGWWMLRHRKCRGWHLIMCLQSRYKWRWHEIHLLGQLSPHWEGLCHTNLSHDEDQYPQIFLRDILFTYPIACNRSAVFLFYLSCNVTFPMMYSIWIFVLLWIDCLLWIYFIDELQM